MDLIELNILMQQGQYNQALQEINNLSTKDQLEGEIFKVRLLTKMGSLKEAHALGKELLNKNKTTNSLQELNLLINFCYCQFALSKLLELSETLQKAEKLFSEIEETVSSDLRHIQGSLYYLRGYFTFYQGDIHQGLEILHQSLDIRQSLENKQDIAETAIAIAWIHLDETGDLESALEFIEMSLKLNRELGNKPDIAFSLHRLGNYYNEKGNFVKSVQYMEESLSIYQELKNKSEIARLQHNIGYHLFSMENFEKATEYIQKSLETYESLNDLNGKSYCYNTLSWINYAQGKFDVSLDYRNKCLQISETLGRGLQSAFSIMSMGTIIQFGKGDLALAREYYERSLQMHRELGSDKMIAFNLIHLSRNHFLQGEIDLALDTINKSLEISTKIENILYQIQGLLYKGIIYKILGKYTVAENYLTDGRVLLKQGLRGGEKHLLNWQSLSLYHLISIAKATNALDKANLYLEELKGLEDQSKRKLNTQRYQFARAIVKTMSKRAVDKFQAQQIFQSIVNEEIVDYNITTLAMLNLSELLILELKISDTEEEVLEEVTILSDKIHEVALSQSSSVLITMSLILKSKLSLVNGDLHEANVFLEEAYKLSKEKKLGTLYNQVINEQNVLHSEFEKWEDLYHRNASIKERIKHARVESYLLEAKKIQETWLKPSTDTIT